MRIYEEFSYVQEYDATTRLELSDDGRFSYTNYFSCYAGGFGGEVRGKWRQSGSAIFLLAENIGEFINRHTWAEGRERQAIERDGCLIFEDNEKLALRSEENLPETAGSTPDCDTAI